MSDDVFRYFIVVAVGLAFIAFVVQAGFIIALYRAIRAMQAKIYPLVERAHPVIEKAGPAIDQAKVMLEKAVPVIEKAGPAIDQAKVVLEKAGPAVEKVGPVMLQAGAAIEKAQALIETAGGILEDSRPRIATVSDEAVRIARTSREQVEHVGDLLHDAGDRARVRLAQIDESVASTVVQVEEAGEAVKRAVMKPVRELNGVAAGISAAVSTLVRGRKSSVDSATQDEEMFI
jgi:hypothetical protein